MRNASGNVVNRLVSKKKDKLMNAFESAKSVDETLKVVKEMESSFEESDLGMESWTLAIKLINRGLATDIEEALHYGKKALRILLANAEKNEPCFGKYVRITDICTRCLTPSYFIARVCNLLGSACYKLKRYDECVSYLNWANRNLTKLEESYDSPCTSSCVRSAMLSTQSHLYEVMIDMGKLGEAAFHVKRILEVEEKFLEKDCIELGEGNMDVCRAYYAAEDFKGALPYCLKALEIHEKHLGRDSVVVKQLMKCLRTIYRILGEGEKAEELEKSLGVTENVGSNSSRVLIEMGKYEEAIDVLEDEVSRDDMREEDRALSFLSMAKAFVKLGKFTDAKKRIRAAKNIFEIEGRSRTYAAIGFGNISDLYEELNDPETALSFVRRAMAIPDVTQPILVKNASRLFSLALRSRKVKEGIPYLEDVVDKLKDSFGPVHGQVANGYINLGLAYFNSGQEELSVKFMKNAKDIMDATLGPNHVKSLKTSQILSVTYAGIGSYCQAMELQEKIIQSLKGLGDQEFMDEAVTHLIAMKLGATRSLTSDSPQFNHSEDLCEMIAKCRISDEEKGKE